MRIDRALGDANRMTIYGECFCGEVKYKIEGKLRNARSCHCSKCRKAFSSQASAYAEVNSDEFEWIAGEERLTLFANQQGTGKVFCSQCGSTLGGIVRGKIHGVTLGCVNGDPGVQLEMHIFVGSKAPWENLPNDGVPQHEERPPAN